MGERANRATTKEEVDRFGSIWKEISEGLFEKGASYPFAPSTCKKKWMTEMGIPYDVPRRPKHQNKRSVSSSSVEWSVECDE
jgi:hypothetical protein